MKGCGIVCWNIDDGWLLSHGGTPLLIAHAKHDGAEFRVPDWDAPPLSSDARRRKENRTFTLHPTFRLSNRFSDQGDFHEDRGLETWLWLWLLVHLPPNLRDANPCW